MWRILLVFCFFFRDGTSQFRYKVKEISDPYEIAGIFENANSIQMFAFNESMQHSYDRNFKVKPVVLQPLRADSYSIWRELCGNTDMRPIAVVGPQSPTSAGAIRDQCAIANIPHIQATWTPLDPDSETIDEQEITETDDEEETIEGENTEDEKAEGSEETVDGDENTKELTYKKITINFYPNSDEISTAMAKLLKYYNWETFSILYEDDFGLMRIQKVLADYSSIYPIRVRRLDPENSNHQVFKELSLYQDSRILLDCHVSRIMLYLDEAQKMNLVDHYQHYIFTSMDTAMVSDSLLKLPCNSSWLSLTQYDRSDLSSRVGKWDPSSSGIKNTIQQFEIEALMMDDIANHVMKSLDNINTKPETPMCENDGTPWEFGAQLQNQILTTKSEGVSGSIEFDEKGRRRNYILYVNEIHVNEKKTIGRWESSNNSAIIETRSYTGLTDKQSTSKVFRIVSRKAKPYFYDKEPCKEEDCEDDDPDIKYEGFSVDLVKDIFKFLRNEGRNYTFQFLPPESGYGKFDEKEKKWDGMIGALLDKKADLAVCDFTITEERKKVIDFSVPFMSLGISILFVQEHKITPGMFSFLNPYTFDVWMNAATAYCAVSIALFICARISPADWENPEPCDKDPEELENIWTFKNCAWLTMGSIMTQGCDILPKAFGTRWICSMWWFFAVIFCQTYIAQLSASMTSALENEPINNVEDLAKQTKILYGAYKYGSTLDFFRTSKDKMYQQMYENMAANPVVLVGSNDEGEERVLRGKGKYAFFMESTTIDYKLKRNCELKKVGPELDSKDYGIAMPANSPFRSHINRAILSLKESNRLEEIKKIWWNSKYNALESCELGNKEDDVEGDLEMENLIGLFVVLIVGLFLCLFVTAAEFFNEIRNIVVREQLTHKEALIQELKASLNFFQLQKPVLRNPSRAPSLQSTESSGGKEKLNTAIENFMDFEKEVQ